MGGQRVSLPIVFGDRQKKRIEEAFDGDWKFKTVEMVKRDGVWFAHFVLAKTVNFEDAETMIAIDRGEVNLAVAVAVSKDNPEKPLRDGSGEEKRLNGQEDCATTSEEGWEKRKFSKRSRKSEEKRDGRSTSNCPSQQIK